MRAAKWQRQAVVPPFIFSEISASDRAELTSAPVQYCANVEADQYCIVLDDDLHCPIMIENVLT